MSQSAGREWLYVGMDSGKRLKYASASLTCLSVFAALFNFSGVTKVISFQPISFIYYLTEQFRCEQIFNIRFMFVEEFGNCMKPFGSKDFTATELFNLLFISLRLIRKNRDVEVVSSKQ